MKFILKIMAVLSALALMPSASYSEECASGYEDDGPTCHQYLQIDAKDTYGRGVGTIPGNCPLGQENNAGLCYPQCESGFSGAGPVCWQNCSSGYDDHGLTCFQHIFEWHWKDSYGRGVGKIPGACSAGEEYDAGLCYSSCATDYTGVGPVCWENCKTGFTDDGAFCRANDNTYAKKDYDASPVYDLAQGCYAIQSPTNGNYLKKYNKGGLIDNGLGYRFESVSVENATHFFFKPSALGNYMMTDKAGRYLASHLPAEISAGRYAGKFADWKTGVIQVGGENRFKFTGNGLNLKLRHNYSTNNLYFFDLLNPINANSEDSFRLVEQSDCAPFPEVTTNVSGDTNALKGDVNEPVRGAADIHAHITANEFMGGKMMHGKPFHRWGVTQALNDSKVVHGPSGALDIIGNLMGETGDVNNRYKTEGWPNFPWWPNRTLNTHSGFYYKWLERAHLGGMRLLVTDLVENEVLCKIQSTVNPASWFGPNSCNVMDSIRLQAKRLYEMQDYIDAQAGGPGKGFFRLVTSPKQARQVIANGQMAVIMGVEASETFNCGKKDQCDTASIEKGLNELYDLGIRSIFPTHRFDNKLSGAHMADGLLNIGQGLSTGHFFETEICDSTTSGISMTNGFPLVGQVPVLKDILDGLGLSPTYDESTKHCNKHGLTHLGEYLVKRMMDKKMMIELDHMSASGAKSVVDMAEARNYSGIMSSHSWLADSALETRIQKAGGVVAVYNGGFDGTNGGINNRINTFPETPYLKSVGFSTDMNGLGAQARPRGDAGSNPLAYPFTSEFGLVFDQQKSGNRIFDENKEGIAHYGLVADYLQDIREKGHNQTYESVMSFAEAYLQMWERTESNNVDTPTSGSEGENSVGISWSELPGMRQVSIAEDGSMWATSGSFSIHRWNGNTWDTIPGSLKHVSVGSAGEVWGVNTSDMIYRYNGSGNGWTRIPGALKNVSVGSDGSVWGVNANDSIYRWNGSGWTMTSGRLKQISVGSAENVWGVSSNNHAYRWNGNGWTQMSNWISNVAVASDGTVWATSPENAVYTFTDEDSWVQVNGVVLSQISVGSNTQVVGSVNSGGYKSYRREF